MNGIPIALEELHSPSSFASSAITVAVAQICLSVGCDGARASVLRAFADITGRYIQALARSAAGAANSRGRTDSNLLDITHAIEDLSFNRGFRGASDHKRPLLKSTVLKEIAAFVRSVDEIPFARPLLRNESERVRVSKSFSQAGKEPPSPHVPRWLPCFPESWGEEETRKGDEGESGPLADSGWNNLGSDPVRRLTTREEVDRELPVKRARVKFRIGLGKKRK